MPRPGYLTPSSFPALMTHGKNGALFGKTALAVVRQLALEKIGFEAEEETPPGGARLWGIEREWEAIQAYEESRLCSVRKPEFTVSPTLPYVGGTMDGLVGPSGGIEVKCPSNPAIHMFDRDAHYRTYRYQIYGYMWVFGLEWIDFVSFDPRHKKAKHRLKVRRLERDENVISELQHRCEKAHAMAIELAKQMENEPCSAP